MSFSFGAAATTPAAPAAGGAGGFSFGATTAASTTPAAPAAGGAGGFSFGASTGASGGFGSPGGFGAAKPAALGGGLGGSTFSLTPNPQALLGGGLLGGAGQQLLQGPPTTPQDIKYNEVLGNLRDVLSAYAAAVPPSMPGYPPTENKKCRFKAVVYTEAKTGGQTTAFPSRPPHVDEKAWRASEGRLMAHDLTWDLHPSLKLGAETLAKWTANQEKKSSEVLAILAKASDVCLARGDASNLALERVDRIRRRHALQSERLVDLMVKLEVLENLGVAVNPEEQLLHARLANLVHGAKRRAAAVQELRAAHAASPAALQPLDPQDQAKLFGALEQQRRGLDRLGQVLGKDRRDLGIMAAAHRG